MTQEDDALIEEAINALNKMDLIDLYYPSFETIAALLRVPPYGEKPYSTASLARQGQGRIGSLLEFLQ